MCFTRDPKHKFQKNTCSTQDPKHKFQKACIVCGVLSTRVKQIFILHGIQEHKFPEQKQITRDPKGRPTATANGQRPTQI